MREFKNQVEQANGMMQQQEQKKGLLNFWR
jgi:hypothetical protein